MSNIVGYKGKILPPYWNTAPLQQKKEKRHTSRLGMQMGQIWVGTILDPEKNGSRPVFGSKPDILVSNPILIIGLNWAPDPVSTFFYFNFLKWGYHSTQ